MSRIIDERTVSMRFDHSKFESGVESVMSALDKLKSRLNFSSNNFDSLSRAANNVDFSGMEREVTKVEASFSVLKTAAFTIIQDITRKVEDMAVSIARAFTIEPVITGFQEYETQINAIQTILSNTAAEGTSLADVTRALDEMNVFADKTIYNFTEMVRNIGTFTAAGVGLWDSVDAIEGIANLAAISGSNATQASTAMYQLSQALAQGFVNLMDWRSVVNAGMGGKYFQNALQETAEQMLRFDEAYQQYYTDLKPGDILDDNGNLMSIAEMIEAHGGFRNAMSSAWISADVLSQTLRNLTESGANEYIAEHTRLLDQDRLYMEDEIDAMRNTAKESGDLEDAYRELAAQLAETSDLTEEEIFNLLNNSTAAENASTEVKTFTQLLSTLKEAAQSGWTESWEAIIGNFDEAKALFTEISDALGGIISAISTRRNDFLSEILFSNWKKLYTAFSDVNISTDLLQDNLEDLAETVGIDLDQFESFEDSLSENWITASVLNDALAATVNQMAEAAGVTLDFSGNVADLSIEQLKSIGMSQEQAETFQQLAQDMSDSGSTITELLSDLGKTGGRELIIDTVRNALTGLWRILQSIGQAWSNIFPEIDTDRIYNLLERIHEFSQNFIPAQETLDKIRRTFEGIFSVLHIIWVVGKTIVTELVQGGLNLLSSLLGTTNIDILEFTANIGDSIKGFHDWLMENDRLVNGIKTFVRIIKDAILKVADFIRTIWGLEPVQNFVNNLKDRFFAFFGGVGDAFTDFKTNVIDRFIESIGGLNNLSLSNIRDFFVEVWSWLSDKLSRIGIDITNFSTAIRSFKDIVINSFSNVRDNFGIIFENIKTFFSNLSDGFANFNVDMSDRMSTAMHYIGVFVDFIKEHIGQIIAIVGLVAAVILGKKLMDGLTVVSGIVDNISRVIKSVSNLLNGMASAFKGLGTSLRANAILKIAISMGILIAAFIALANVDLPHIEQAAIVLGVMLGALTGVTYFLNKMDSTIVTAGGKGGKIEKASTKILKLAFALAIVAAAVTIIANLDVARAWNAVGVIAALLAMLGGIAVVLNKFASDKMILGDPTSHLLKMAISLVIVVGALAVLNKMDLGRTVISATIALGVMAIMALITKLVKTDIVSGSQNVFSPLMKMALSLLLVVAALAILNSMDLVRTQQSLLVVIEVLGAFVLVMWATRLAGTEAQKAGVFLIGIGAAMILIAAAIKVIEGISLEGIAKGIVTCAAMMLLFTMVINLAQFSGEHAAKAGIMLIGMSVAILILVGSIYLLTLLNGVDLRQPMAVLAGLVGLLDTAIFVSYFAGKATASIIAIAIAIGLIGIVIAALSFIEPARLDAASNALTKVTSVFVLLYAVFEFFGSLLKGPELLSALGAVGICIAIVAALAACLGLMVTFIPDLDGALKAAEGLSLVLLAFSAALAVMTTVGNVGGLVAGGSGGVALLGLLGTALIMIGIVGLLAVFIWRLTTTVPDPNAALTVSMGLALVMVSFAAMLGVFGIIGFLVPTALLALAGITQILYVFGGLALTIGAWLEDGTMDIVMRGAEMIKTIMRLFGEALGSAISGFLIEASSALPTLGYNMSVFAVNLMPFIMSMKMVDEDVLTGITTIASALLVLSASSFINAIAGLLGSNIAGMSGQLVVLGDSLVRFAMLVGLVRNWDVVERAGNAVKDLFEALSAAPRTGGLMDVVFGMFNPLNILVGLRYLGEGIYQYGYFVSNIKDFASIITSGPALLMLMKALEQVPTTGGLIDMIWGFQLFGALPSQLSTLGLAIVSYNEQVKKVSDWHSTIASAEPLVSLFNAMAQMPNEWGLAGIFAGNQNYANLKNDLESMGEGIAAYADAVAGHTDWSGVGPSAEALVTLFRAMAEAPNQDGVLGFWAGNQDYANMDRDLEAMGSGLASFAREIDGIDMGNIADAAQALVALMIVSSVLPMYSTMNGIMRTFGVDLGNLGAALRAYSDDLDGVDTKNIEDVTAAVQHMLQLFRTINGDDMAIPGQYSNSVTTGISQITDSLNLASVQWPTTGNAMFDGLLQTVMQGSSEVTGEMDVFSSSLNPMTYTNITDGAWMLGDAMQGNFNEMNASFSSPEAQQILDNAGQFGTGITDGTVESILAGNPELESALQQFLGNTDVFDSPEAMQILNLAGQYGGELPDSVVDSIAGGNPDVAAAVRQLVASTDLNSVPTSQKPLTSAQQYGQKIPENMSGGMRSRSSAVDQALNDIAAIPASQTYRNNVYNNMYSTGSYGTTGMEQGIRSKIDSVSRAARDVANSAMNTAKRVLDEHSPSRKFYEIGNFAVLGFVNALTDGIGSSGDAAEELATSALDNFEESISNIVTLSDVISDTLDTEPVITPIVDLSNAKRGAQALNAMMSSVSARKIADGLARAEFQNGANSNGENSNNGITFIQNNYSPKALSRIEVYRQTKNQLSQLERIPK